MSRTMLIFVPVVVLVVWSLLLVVGVLLISPAMPSLLETKSEPVLFLRFHLP